MKAKMLIKIGILNQDTDCAVFVNNMKKTKQGVIVDGKYKQNKKGPVEKTISNLLKKNNIKEVNSYLLKKLFKAQAMRCLSCRSQLS
jgi:hypothetical protein